MPASLPEAGLPQYDAGAARRKFPLRSGADERQDMARNLCRCTGYERIIDAVMSLQDVETAP
ncbi:2Fe-2S iron-sulfur cluster-binding protein [Roseovarius arcticus]|uniref:2Fe-2S iron-sulfur cluster-binding protein n=1 Tax=Roseovarius arcticus TaxID=2547404 RepID=UPI0014866BFA|nr:2Fe-2S iron-sulfur cluster-binding protein [Roseovarius arcticus]